MHNVVKWMSLGLYEICHYWNRLGVKYRFKSAVYHHQALAIKACDGNSLGVLFPFSELVHSNSLTESND